MKTFFTAPAFGVFGPQIFKRKISLVSIISLALFSLTPFLCAQVDGLGLTWSTLTEFSGTSSPTSQMRSLRSLALSADGQYAFVGFLSGTTSSGLRKVRISDGAVVDSVTIGASRAPKGGATDDRGYVYFSSSIDSPGSGQFRIYDSELTHLTGLDLAGSQRVGGICLRKFGSSYYLYVAREATSSAIIERYNVDEIFDLSLDPTFGTGGQFNVQSHYPAALSLTGLDVDDDGTIYQTTRDANALIRIAPSLGSVITTTLSKPMDVAIRSNRVYVTHYDGTNSFVSVLRKSDLTYLCKLTTGIVRANVASSGYAGIDISDDGKIYMADQIYSNTPSTLFLDRVLVSSVLPDEPAITSDPQNKFLLTGENLTNNASATGTAPLAYQWFRNSISIASGTDAELVIENVATNDSGNYFMTASNIAGVATSAVAVVTIVQPVSISADPDSATKITGENYTFNVGVEGSAPFSYQWYFNNNPILDETNSTLAKSGLQLLDGGDYFVVVTNAGGSATSAVATLTVILDVTQTPTLVLPASDSTHSNLVEVEFSLPEVALAGSVQLIFDSTNNTLDRVFSLGGISGTGTHSFTFDINNPLATPAIISASLNDLSVGTYDVSISYQDALGHDAALDTKTNILIDVTVPPLLTTPAANSISGRNVYVSYTLPDAPLSGSITLFFNNPTNDALDRTFTLSSVMEVAGTTNFTFPMDNPLSSTALFSANPANNLSNGLYSIVLSYQDSAGNALASTTNVNVKFILDTNAPTVTVVSPKMNGIYSNALPLLGISGTAKDNVQVTNVEYNFNNAGFTPAFLSSIGKTTNWGTNINMLPGTNTLWVRATDSVGNVSKTNKVTFFWHVPDVFGLVTNGLGKIDPVSAGKVLGNTTNEAPLFVGRTYSVVASVISNDWLLTNITYTAANGESGELFLNTNSLTKYKLPFTMKTNLVITAHFITNPLVQFSGTYNGLFHEPDEVKHHSAGYFTMNVTRKSACSGKLFLDGNTISFSGKLLIDGAMNKVVSRAKVNKSDLQLYVALDFTGGGMANGAVSGTSLSGENFTSNIDADRAVWTTNSGQQALQFTNRYTMVITGLTSSVEGPEGFGYAAVDLTSAKGQIKVSGELSDSYKKKVGIAQATTVSTNGVWPFFSAMYPTTNRAVTNFVMGVWKTTYPKENHGIVMGWLNFGENTNAGTLNLAPLGPVDWIKTTWTNDSWQNGFTNQVMVNSSRHLPPVTGTTDRIYNFTNAWVELFGGQLGGSFSNVVNLKTNNTFFINAKDTNQPVNHKFAAALTSKTGFISGTFTNFTASGKTNINWQGVMLQDQNYGLGFFMDHAPHTNSSGKVVLIPKD